MEELLSHIKYYSLMFFIAYAFKGQVHGFTGQVKIVSHSSCRTSAILKHYCPLQSKIWCLLAKHKVLKKSRSGYIQDSLVPLDFTLYKGELWFGRCEAYVICAIFFL